MMRVALPPAEFLRQCFEYRPDTGELISRPRPVGHFRNAHVAAIWNAKFAGEGRWRARIKVDGRSIHLGIFDDKEDAHRAFLAAAALYQGAFAAA